MAGINRGEPQVIHREVMERRMRDIRAVGLRDDVAHLGASGYSLGQLYLRGKQDRSDPGSISGSQFATGRAWAALVRRHAHAVGSPDAPPCPMFRMVKPNPDPVDNRREELTEDEKIERLEDTEAKWLQCNTLIKEACAIHGNAVREILYSVCVSDLPLERMLQSSYGLLRIGLNSLSRVI